MRGATCRVRQEASSWTRSVTAWACHRCSSATTKGSIGSSSTGSSGIAGANPFGHSSTNLGSLYKGLVKDTSKYFKRLRKTRHTHNPVDDAKGNAEALLAMKGMGLRIKL